MATPRYQLTDDMPVPGLQGSGMLLKGSIIEMDATREPGPHMIPLNAEAEAEMENFYNREFAYKVFNKDTGQTETRKHQPRQGLRPVETPIGAGPVGSISLVAPPPEPSTKGMSLAELSNTAPKMEGPIPGPDAAKVVREEFRDKAKVAALDPAPDPTLPGDLSVVSAAPPDPKAPKITTK
jgi:hypothetical protein